MIKKIAKAYLKWHDSNIKLMRRVDLLCFILYSYLVICAVTQGIWIFFGYIIAFWALSLMTVVFDIVDTYKDRKG